MTTARVVSLYVLGTPETSLSGRNTRTARNVRRTLPDDVVPLADIVINLPQQYRHHIYFRAKYTTVDMQTKKRMLERCYKSRTLWS